jgi:cytochrome c biogenesis protein CcmG/thiol:disulfide interchange protein DsbE
MRRLVFLLPVLLFIVVAGYFAWSLRPGYDSKALPSALLDKDAPAFDLPALAGDARVALGSVKGQPTVVNFFASWCAPCRIEHPILMRLARQQRVNLVGIAYKDKTADTIRFLDQLGNPFGAVGLDPDGRTGLDFGVYGVPETYVLDRDGRIRQRFVGPLSAETVERDLLPLLRRLSDS